MTIYKNPFYVIKASPKDTKAKLIELEEIYSLKNGIELSPQIRMNIMNSRKRLSSEIAWLPGVEKVLENKILEEYVKEDNVDSLIYKYDLNPICLSNLISSKINKEIILEEKISLIRLLINISSEINSSEVSKLINQDRKLSGFPIIENIKYIENEINERIYHYKNRIIKSLEDLPLSIQATELLKIMNNLKSDIKYSKLLDSVISHYEIESKELSNEFEEYIFKHIRNIKIYPDNFNVGFPKIEEKLYYWSQINAPIHKHYNNRNLDELVDKELILKLIEFTSWLVKAKKEKHASKVFQNIKGTFIHLDISEILSDEFIKEMNLGNKSSSQKANHETKRTVRANFSKTVKFILKNFFGIYLGSCFFIGIASVIIEGSQDLPGTESIEEKKMDNFDSYTAKEKQLLINDIF